MPKQPRLRRLSSSTVSEGKPLPRLDEKQTWGGADSDAMRLELMSERVCRVNGPGLWSIISIASSGK
ncbi:hypothetical protein NUU61_006022 [Penicillium alfredii]|uniref:Uncharacterized protein n=1 Tax=Penicillium alfredii TaxID=1506179 RepID=A0A9W9F073_9EURO|nr:uncharacterized protein NUU61_006022 [Penicillium alfredii]KAJ5091152.1 hypothetical protein NUU61_006022 [Penicillium alfredii]